MSSIYNDDCWSLFQSAIDGKLVIIRARSYLPSKVDRQLFPVLVTVAWRYDANEHGMPPPSVVEQISSLDEALGSKFAERGAAVEVASITGNSVKEWRFYATDAEAFMSAFNAALSGHPRYPLEFNAYADLLWAALAELGVPHADS